MKPQQLGMVIKEPPPFERRGKATNAIAERHVWFIERRLSSAAANRDKKGIAFKVPGPSANRSTEQCRLLCNDGRSLPIGLQVGKDLYFGFATRPSEELVRLPFRAIDEPDGPGKPGASQCAAAPL